MLQTRKRRFVDRTGGSGIYGARQRLSATLDDFNHIVLKASENGVPVFCVMLRRSRLARRCAGALPNERRRRSGGRGGDPAFRQKRPEVIAAVKDKLETLKSSLPEVWR